MKRMKKVCAIMLGIVMLVGVTAFAAVSNSASQDGIQAIIQTDKNSYDANEDIRVNITVTNTNNYTVKNVSIEGLLPDDLTLKEGSLKSDTVNLNSGETLTIDCVAVLEKEIVTEPDSTESDTTESTTEETTESTSDTTEESTETDTETTEPEETETTTEETSTVETTETEPTSVEPSTVPDTTDGEIILPIEPTTERNSPSTTVQDDYNENAPQNPSTGDSFTFIKVLTCLAVAGSAIIGIVVIQKKNGKKATKVISLILCGTIAFSGIAATGFLSVTALESDYRSFTVQTVVTVDGGDYTISASVNYSEKAIESEEIEKELENIKNINDGVLPDIVKNEEYNIPSFIHGKYTEKEIMSAEDAIASLSDVQYLFGIDDPKNEFKCTKENTMLGSTYYRLQQYYDGFLVDDAQLIVAVDEDNQAESINGTYVPVNFDLLPVSISVQEAKQIVLKEFKTDIYVSKYVTSILYKDEETENYYQAYKVFARGYDAANEYLSGDFIVSAITGDILNVEKNTAMYTTVHAIGMDNKGNQRNFNVEQDADNLYRLANYEKNIRVYDVSDRDFTALNAEREFEIIEKKDGTYTIPVRMNNDWHLTDEDIIQDMLVTSSDNTWDNTAAVTVYSDLNDIYDYYLSMLGIKGYGGINARIEAFVNDDLDGDTKNAYSCNFPNSTNTVLCFGYENGLNLDTIAHEYTHSIVGSVVNLKYEGETGAVSEAYADILGEIIEKDTSWTNAEVNRNMADPQSKQYPDYKYGEYWKNTTNTDDDHGGVHTNSTVISHAAYLMNQKGISMDDLAKIFIKSANYLDEQVTFERCARAVIQAAALVNPKYVSIAEEAFEEVGVFAVIYQIPYQFYGITGAVMAENTKEPIANATVSVYDGNTLLGQTQTSESGTYQLSFYSNSTSLHFTLEIYKYDRWPYIDNQLELKNGVTTVVENIYMKLWDSGLEPGENPTPDDNFAGGDGSVENPYQIATARQLDAVRNHLDSNFVLVNDIDLSEYSNWVPIGGYENVEEGDGLRGSFDGQGHTISNLRINCIDNFHLDENYGSIDYAFGLFSDTFLSTGIKNINLYNVNIVIQQTENAKYTPDDLKVASLSAIASNVVNCHTSGNITVIVNSSGYVQVGGISSEAVCVSDSSSSVDIHAISKCDISVGGIIATSYLKNNSIDNRLINNCVNYGNIYAEAEKMDANVIKLAVECSVAGIIGNGSATISSCQNYGSIKGKSYCEVFAAGIAGDFYGVYGEANIQQCANFGQVDAVGAYLYVGGILAYTWAPYDVIQIVRCVNYGNLSTNTQNGGYWRECCAYIGAFFSGYDTGSIYLSNCYNLGTEFEVLNFSDTEVDVYIGRIVGDSTARYDYNIYLSNCYSLDSTLLNGLPATEDISSDQKNGGSMTRAEIEKAVTDLGFELPGQEQYIVWKGIPQTVLSTQK